MKVHALRREITDMYERYDFFRNEISCRERKFRAIRTQQ